MNMRFGTWNVRSLYRAGSLMTVGKGISKYKILREYRSDGTAGEYLFLYGKGNENHELVTGFSYIRESYQQLRG
jgi:hypothetical protein